MDPTDATDALEQSRGAVASIPDLHAAVLSRDADAVRAVLEALAQNRAATGNSSLNALDHVGNTALHLAVLLVQPDIVRLLVEAGADPRTRSSRGWSALDEAIVTGEIEIVRTVYAPVARALQATFAGQLPLLFAELERTDDCFLEFAWGATSWIPFVSRLCPSDTYQIWKQGSDMRLDIASMNWSFLFRGKQHASPGEILLVNHTMREYCVFNPTMLSPTDVLIEEDVQDLMRKEIVQMSFNRHALALTPKMGWFGAAVTEQVAGHTAQVHNFAGVEIAVEIRSEHVPSAEGVQPTPYAAPRITLDEYRALPPNYRLKGRHIVRSRGRRTLAGSVSVAEPFPINMALVKMLLEIQTPTLLSIEPLRELIDFIPPGFPVKFDLPFMSVIHIAAGIREFARETTPEHVFAIPEGYQEQSLVTAAERDAFLAGTVPLNHHPKQADDM